MPVGVDPENAKGRAWQISLRPPASGVHHFPEGARWRQFFLIARHIRAILIGNSALKK
jgi:hypothetical protein